MTNPSPDTIIILTPAFPQNETETWWVPSQQLMVQAIQRQFPALNIEVVSLLYPKISGAYRWQQSTVRPVNGLRYNKLLRPLRWQAVWQQLNAIRRKSKLVGILSFWCGEAAWVGHWFGRRYSIRHISWICGQDAASSNLFPKFLRIRATELAAMSHFLAQSFHRNHGVKPAYIISNAIDIRSFPLPSGISRNIDIAGVGSFEPLKRYPMWVDIIGTLKNSVPSIKAIHYGMGVEQELCTQLIEELQLEAHCFLAGPQSHETILQALQRTKILLHTSRYEGCSTVCLEALYAGAKVISFCYPFEQAVPNWYVVNTKEEMIAKVLELLLDPALSYQSTLIHSMDETAREMMRLFAVNASNAPLPLQANNA